MMSQMFRRPMLAMLMAAGALSACGGGGGDAGSTDGFAAAQAWTNLLAANRSWSLSGSDNYGNTYQITEAIRVGTNGTFPVSGATTRRVFQEESVSLNGGGATTGTNTLFLDLSSGLPLGSQFVDPEDGSSTCSLTSGATLPPATAMLGDQGVLFTAAELNGCTSTSAQTGSTTLRWRLDTENGINYFCLNEANTDSSGSVTADMCYEVDTAGTIGSRARLTITMTVTGGSLRLVARTAG